MLWLAADRVTVAFQDLAVEVLADAMRTKKHQAPFSARVVASKVEALSLLKPLPFGYPKVPSHGARRGSPFSAETRCYCAGEKRLVWLSIRRVFLETGRLRGEDTG